MQMLGKVSYVKVCVTMYAYVQRLKHVRVCMCIKACAECVRCMPMLRELKYG
jgi:hypothetical protein